MAEVKISGFSKSFGELTVLPPLDLIVPDGSFTVLVGPSGCGKSTLLRMIAGLEEPNEGLLELDGTDVTLAEPFDRGIAMVFQSYALYPHMTVYRNIEFGLKLARMPASERKQRIERAAEILHLDRLLDRKPAALSGGQRQRVAIGRAIVRDPKVFLFDEPLSNLDAALRSQMRIELAELHQRLGTTMIYVTHDQVEAMTLADQIVVMNRGRIEQIGTPMDLYDRPRTRFVAEFIGTPKMNLIEGPFARRLGAATVGLRPEDVAIVPAGGVDCWPAKVRLVEQLGSETIIYSDSPDLGPVTISTTVRVPRDVGGTVHLSPDLNKAHLFGTDGARIEQGAQIPA